jgi:hypothetical protein
MRIGLVGVVLAGGLTACNGAADVEPEPLPGLGILGHETHSQDSVNVEILADDGDGLNRVMDMAFNPEADGELWIVNATDDSVVIVHGATSSEPSSEKIIDPYALHFMDEVSAISFGDPGLFGTSQESSNTYNGWGDPNYFMGPALWSSDLEVFGTSNPEAVEYLSDKWDMFVDLGSHLDMLHDSPLSTGIEWSHGNAYWVFDGYHDAVSLQDFKEDHGVGWDDHNDGEILRYASGEVKSVTNVHSGMVLDRDNNMLYISDSGNGRIAVLDTTSGTMGARLPQVDEKPYPVHNLMDDAQITTVVSEGVEVPSGLVWYEDHLLVADNKLGRISAYTTDGELVDYLDLDVKEGALQGLHVGPDGFLYVADGKDSRVLRISPNPAAFEETEEE